MPSKEFRLLAIFRAQFLGRIYRHRSSGIGNRIGRELFEDLFGHEVSVAYSQHVLSGVTVADSSGRIAGRKVLRRNDTMFGRLPAGQNGHIRQGFNIPEGPIASPRIGCEVKIIAKDPLSQIDRVISDLNSFSARLGAVNK